MTMPHEYLEELVWDKEPRLATWAQRYLGVDAADEWAAKRAAMWMVSAVARVFEPGCRVDGVLTLLGSQGSRKSSALRALGGPFFCDGLPDARALEFPIMLRGAWIVEVEGIELMTGREFGWTRLALLREADWIRLPFNASASSLPRTCVFAVTADVTWPGGDARFWWVRCGRIDSEAIERDRDQLWAEAAAAYGAGMPWWVEEGAC